MSVRRVVAILGAILVIAALAWGGLVFFRSHAPQTAADTVGPTSSGTHDVPTRPAVDLRSRLAEAAGIDDLPPNLRVEPGQLLVLDPPEGFADAIAPLGFTIRSVNRLHSLGIAVFLLEIPENQTLPDAEKALSARFPGVTFDANTVYGMQGVNGYEAQLPRPMAGWRIPPTACGVGLRLGMIDGSVETSHPALKGRRIEFASFHSDDRKPGPADHGTSIAGILVGNPAWGGLLPGAELFAANMFEYNEAGKLVGNGLALLKAIDWMAEKQVQVVNLSIAGGDNRVVRKAFEIARKKGLLMVAAAGNWGRTANPAYPAAYSDVLAVTAFAADRTVYDRANQGPYIDFAAPGVQIYTAVPEGGRFQSGTSFAAPYVSALVAAAVEKGADRTPSALRELLAQHIVDLGAPGKDNVFGWGFANVDPPCQ